jgi:hypothetical protein
MKRFLLSKNKDRILLLKKEMPGVVPGIFACCHMSRQNTFAAFGILLYYRIPCDGTYLQVEEKTGCQTHMLTAGWLFTI